MPRPSKQAIFATVLFCFFALVLVMWEGDSVQSLSRSGEVILQNDRSDSGDQPFLTSVKVASETSEKIIFDVEYFMSDTLSGKYSISIHPDNSDWAQSMNTLRPGLNSERVTVSFRSKSPKKKSVSNSLLIYINHYEDGAYVSKVFDRTVAFPKNWQRL